MFNILKQKKHNGNYFYHSLYINMHKSQLLSIIHIIRLFIKEAQKSNLLDKNQTSGGSYKIYIIMLIYTFNSLKLE